MHLFGILHPEDLTTLTKALNDWCQRHNIIDEGQRELAAACVLALFKGGALTEADLATGLQQQFPDGMAA